MLSKAIGPVSPSNGDRISSPKRHRAQVVTRTVAVTVVMIVTSSLISITLFLPWSGLYSHKFAAQLHAKVRNPSRPVSVTSIEPPHSPLQDRKVLRRMAQRNPYSWLRYLRNSSITGKVNTQRIGCREMEAGAQSCVYEGFTCINTSSTTSGGRPEVYFLVDEEENGKQAYGDMWCDFRHQSTDPHYYGSRHWPILEGTFTPQQSCLNAYYRSQKSLFGGHMPKLNIRWFDSLWLIDLDYQRNPHNNHLFMDLLWVLDVVLWQKSMDLRRHPDDTERGVYNDSSGHLFSAGPKHLYLPQGEQDFIEQTSKDVNRLLYSLILQRNLSQLYPNFTAAGMRRPSKLERFTEPLLDAYPDLKLNERLLFHKDLTEEKSVDLVCAPRFTSGAKIANGAHERVCRLMRQQSYEFFGVKEPQMQRNGMLYYPQPPKRLIILQRHISRGIANLNELEQQMRQSFSRYDIEIEVVSTSDLVTAEDQVRTFSRAGVLLTTHGSQSMGQIWMPRYSALIEIMPVGYTDYSFKLLTESCKVWYYELQGRVPKNSGPSNEEYERECGEKTPHLVSPCNEFKSEPVTVHIDQAVNKVRYAFERMGHEVGPWLDTVNSGLWMS